MLAHLRGLSRPDQTRPRPRTKTTNSNFFKGLCQFRAALFSVFVLFAIPGSWLMSFMAAFTSQSINNDLYFPLPAFHFVSRLSLKVTGLFSGFGIPLSSPFRGAHSPLEAASQGHSRCTTSQPSPASCHLPPATCPSSGLFFKR